ncbi:FkbM family methyltransferase [Halorubellus sp. JP-L1]|uniref:FkbM family methyltransferase n=1 Tax=Halorubellus sp. JP-L1 TaxID=2715753 RepID=UPI00140DD99E|nr:FkbM family methyltransferase [Halorubellus sp. JP-L1]NHN41444.1 FkbM family methyltransferase [Halorubellus sp. JP-L1]
MTECAQVTGMLGSVTSRVGSATDDGDTDRVDQPGTVQSVYNRFLRPHLPYKLSTHNGVTARGAKLFDFTDRFPEYEAAIIDSLRERVRTGDDVVVVGGGFGVSSVVAANHVGETGSVTTYEGGADQYGLVREALELNGVTDRVDVEHAIVGSAVSLYTPPGDARVVDATELPACDVLEMDCEGAELDVLRNLEIEPRVVVVETHANFGSPEGDVREELDRLGYEVVDREAEIAEDGIFVLTAVRDE